MKISSLSHCPLRIQRPAPHPFPARPSPRPSHTTSKRRACPARCPARLAAVADGDSAATPPGWTRNTPVELRLFLFLLAPRSYEESRSRWPRNLSDCRAASSRPLPPAARAPSGRARGRRHEKSVVNREPLLCQLEVARSDTNIGSRSSCQLSSALGGTPRVRCRRGPAAAPMAGRRRRR